MGLSATTLGLAMGGASALSSLVGGIASSNQQAAQAAAQQANANNLRAQAKMQEEQNQVELEANDKQRHKLRQQYEQAQGQNRVNLGAGNVDLSSGSAMAVQDANADAFAADVGENAYQRDLKEVEGQNKVKNTLYQADVAEAQADYLSNQSSSFVPTLLNTALAGASGFMTGYSFGGKLLGAGTTTYKYWDRALQAWSDTPVRH